MYFRQKTQALLDCKATFMSKSEILSQKKSLLEEVNSEKQRLQREKKLLREMLHNINQDLNSILEAEQALTKESEDLESSLTKLRNEKYEPLHDQVNEMRTRNGMSKLPHIQQELEAKMARILEERRVQWQEEVEASPRKKAKSRRS
ncbi:uncharacterized protein B0P05DRAFT_555389 [Gilbertella persicaria]|uniref:uncharacterized protein n=1 Tax=Gilbertella persicaria TaxID=101096 RepID=UPI00221FE056|nr:uncharacterized protein B0P05DRAFT_555389 [Gilbertella persicaria]KAI8063713.1 hypothetical protein B0P05DRAFT_555389 [Gilbertella persicaria]